MLRDWLIRRRQGKRSRIGRNISRIVLKAQNRIDATNASPGVKRLLSNGLQVFAPSLRHFPLASYGARSTVVARLAPETRFVTEPPRLVGAPPAAGYGIFPEIAARLFSGAEVFGAGSAIIDRLTIAVPPLYLDRPDLLITDGTFLISQKNGRGVAHCPSPATVPSGVALFASGVTNWYHWLIEILPAALLAEALPAEFDSFPFLVPEECLKHQTFRDSLALFTTGQRQVRTLPAGKPVKVGKLIHIDGVVSGPMNLIEGKWPTASDYSQNGDVLLRYREALLERLGVTVAKPDRRIFLARGHGRRTYNQDELLEIAKGFGFEAVYPERLSFREQAETFASAEMVMGPSGAAFANMLFCQKDTRGLTWLLPQYAGFCAYSNLAKVVGMDLRYLFVTPHTPIRSSFDAYSAAYTLEAERFSDALQQMDLG